MTPKEIDEAISDIETGIERLQALYNQYFMGIERIEPTIHRKNVDRKIQALRRERIGNTAQRFRFQTQLQKYNTHSTHWSRICRQIEEGTYSRHVSLAKRRQAKRIKKEENPPFDPATLDVDPGFQLGDTGDGSPPVYEIDPAAIDGFSLDEPFDRSESLRTGNPVIDPMDALDIDDPFSDAPPLPTPAVPEKPAPKKRMANRPPPSPRASEPRSGPSQTERGFDKQRAESVYRTFVAARKKCNQPTQGLSLEKVVRSLKKQYDKKGGAVDFKVVIRDGKAGIKAVRKSDKSD
ncbi:MAG: MXAN_5187 C-terminal domain-containing protein [Myxococcota bacterium]|nr:MXAN_5187 C-terminal domain-containing protein [Myxococcota bacterium]